MSADQNLTEAHRQMARAMLPHFSGNSVADHSHIPDEAVTASVVEPTTPGPLPGVDDATNAKLDSIEVDLRGGYVRSGEHIAEDPDEYRDEQFVNVADLPSIIHAWAAAALPVLNTARATCDEPMPVEGNAEEAQTCDHPAIPGTNRCPVHDPRHVEYLADLVAEIRQKDLELEEWRTGVLRLPLDASKADDDDRPVCPCVTNDDYVHPSLRGEQ